MVLHIRDLHHAYKDQKVLQGIDMTLKRGQIACLLGPSGAEKPHYCAALQDLKYPSLGRLRLQEKRCMKVGRV